jgi:hypothetical protein
MHPAPQLGRERATFLQQRFRDGVRRVPEYALIRRALMGVAKGTLVIPPEDPKARELRTMVAVGQTYALPVRLHVMRARCCHENVDELFRDKGYDFGTGWAYTEDDGLWRQHSWAFDGDTIVETTTPRDIYWGARLPRAMLPGAEEK